MSTMNFKQVIQSFLDGATEGCLSGQGNLKIHVDQLIHYFTPILERYGDGYILNYTRYSLVTGRLQKQITEIIPEENITKVQRVPENYKGSREDFIKRNDV